MALVLETSRIGGEPSRTLLVPGRNVIAARPGETYRIVDDAGEVVRGVQVTRIGDDLVVQGLAPEQTLELSGFFTACLAGDECTLATDTLGAGAGGAIGPRAEPLAALADGSFLMYAPGAPLAAGGASTGVAGGMDVKSIAAVGAGVLVLGAALGGGGGNGGSAVGGGGGSDTVAPAVTITGGVPGAASGPITFTFTFSEPVTGFDAGDVAVTGGAKGAFTAVSGSVYTLVVAPPASTSGTITVAVPASAATDAAGNPSREAATLTQAFNTTVPDVTPPTVTIADDAIATATGPVTFLFVFNEPVTGFDAGDVVVTGGAKGAFTAVSDSVYTLVVTPPAASAGTITVSVPAGVATDAAGNPSGASAPASQAFDTTVADVTPPTLAITDNAPAAVAGGPVTFTFAFSEPVAAGGPGAFIAGDVVVTGGTAGTLAAGAGNTYTLTVTPPAATTGTLGVSVAPGTVTDVAGNALQPGASASQPFDTDAPRLTISDDVGAATATGPVTFTFIFSEPVSGFDAGDVSVVGGTRGAFSNVGVGAYTLVVTPTAATTGIIEVSVPGGAATDAAGTASLAAQANQPFDTRPVDNTPPTLAITDNVPAALANGPVTFTFAFSEPVAASGPGAFTAGDVVVTGGTAGTLAAGAGNTYTLTVTPAAGTTGTLGVNVAPGIVTDVAGNALQVGTSASQAFDTAAPVNGVAAFGVLDNVGSAQGPIPYGGTTDDVRPAVTLTLTDVLAPGESLRLFRDGGTTPVATLSAGSAVLIHQEPPLSSGAHAYTASITDTAGNVTALDLNGALAGNAFTFTVL